MSEKILSVGIDIGTTTSQIIFSQLTIENRASISRVPQINITDKEIIYKSKIYFTPLLTKERIDGDALAAIITKEYQQAHITPKDITVGAVIITGESSRKENSQEIVHALGNMAGDFVIASAGPALEGIIAGRGSGAAELSKQKKCIVANIDIGGGTSNIAVYDDGVPIDTSCLDIGGRQIKFNTQGLKVEYIAPKTKQLINRLQLSIEEGKIASPSELKILCEKYTNILLEALLFTNQDNLTELLELMITDHKLRSKHNLSYVVISGGVAESVYDDFSLKDSFMYADIGILLGQVIKQIFPLHFSLIRGVETIHATVIGAGAYTASLSGSTIHIADDLLPLKNIPVIKFSLEEEQSLNSLSGVIQQKIDWVWDSSLKGIVLGFTLNEYCSYKFLKEFAVVLNSGAQKLQQYNQLLIILIENDLAKALGQVMSNELIYPFMTLDSIVVQDGDFIDIGTPLYENKVVPVVVKSLIFNK